MTKTILALLVLSLCVFILPAPAQTASSESGGLRLGASSGASFPLGASADEFVTGFLADLSGSYYINNNLFVDINAGYSRLPLLGGPSAETGRAELGFGLAFPFGGSFDIEGIVRGGGYYSALANSTVAGSTAGASASASLLFHYRPIKKLELEAGGRYRYLFGLWNGLEAILSARLKLDPPRKASPSVPMRYGPLTSGSLSLAGVEFGDVFPVFFKYYNAKPLGTARFVNNGTEPITDLSVSFYAKQYMDAPKLCAKLDKVEPGQEIPVDLVALFTDSILGVTEGTMVSAEIAYAYTEAGEAVSTSSVEAMRVLDRNAMSWFDDRCAAAYVTAKDPSILGFSKNVASSIKDDMNPAVNKSLQIALGLHEALDLYGINYTIDPKSAYASSAQDKAKIDFLQFPRQTLEYKAGDCDDLSILFSAMLESVGIETAFVTVPGHIFMAFSLDMTPETARKTFSSSDEFIMKDGKVWLPVEITDRKGGFLAAWQTGAKEWRENYARGLSGFLPVHEAWTVFEPVQLPGSSVSLAPPGGDAFLAKFKNELLTFVDREIFPQVEKLKADMANGQATPRLRNSLGVVYAKYGLYDQAAEEFAKVVEELEYVPCLLNLGNILSLKNQPEQAAVYYERAYRIEPKNPKTVLSYARANHEAENYGLVKKLYDELKTLDAALAAQFAYLDLKGEEAARAADITQAKEIMVWLEEDK